MMSDDGEKSYPVTVEVVSEEHDSEIGYTIYKEAKDEGLVWDQSEEACVRRKVRFFSFVALHSLRSSFLLRSTSISCHAFASPKASHISTRRL